MSAARNNSSQHDTPHIPSLEHDERRFASQYLISATADIAAAAADALCKRHPDTAQRFGALAKDRWREHFTSRLADLAASVMAGERDVFVEQVAWARIAFEARGVPAVDLHRSLVVLSQTLEHELPAEDRAPVLATLNASIDLFANPSAEPLTALKTSNKHGELAARYLLAILEGDRQRASDLVLRAVHQGLPAIDVYEHILQPVQVELGRMWHLSELTVAEEHFATATSKLVMAQLLPLLPKKPRNGKVLLAASVEGNAHDMGVQMVADFFEMEGYRSIFLGPSVPAADMVTAVEHFSVDIVAISAALPTQLRAVEDTVQGMRHAESELVRKAKVIVGGPAFAHTGDLWREVGADALARTPRDAIEAAQRWSL